MATVPGDTMKSMAKPATTRESLLNGIRVIDGGLASELEYLGARIDGPLWSAQVLEDDEERLLAVHRAFIEAGAECIATASYQVSRMGYTECGFSPERADAAMLRSVELARQAAAAFPRRRVLIAGSLGPYGAALHNGAEYTGDYSISYADLVRFHRERIEVFARAGTAGAEARPTSSASYGPAKAVPLLRDPEWDSSANVRGTARAVPLLHDPKSDSSANVHGPAKAAPFQSRTDAATDLIDTVPGIHLGEQRPPSLAPDLLAFETFPSLEEAKAVCEALAPFPWMQGWLSFSCRDEKTVSHGEPLRECAALLDACPQILAVGVNCVPPQWAASLIGEIRAGTAKPVLVYPNSGEGWDAATRCWTGSTDPGDFGRMAAEWFAAGAQIVGGCCRTRPEHIRAIVKAARQL